MAEVEMIEGQIRKKEEELEKLRLKIKRKKSELHELEEKKKILSEKKEAEFNARVVSEMEQRFGKLDEKSFGNFLEDLDQKKFFSDRLF